MTVVVMVLCSLGGLLVVGHALRGRRVGTTPYCRGCGFDLTGSPDSAHCPECNARLSDRHAVVRGKRIRSMKRVLTVMTPTLSLLIVALVIVYRPHGYTYAPPTWLMRLRFDLLARDELFSRAQAGQLTPAQQLTLASDALIRQPMGHADWPTRDGRLIELALGQGLLTSDPLRQYVEQSGTLMLSARGRQWRALPVTLHLQWVRKGPIGGDTFVEVGAQEGDVPDFSLGVGPAWMSEVARVPIHVSNPTTGTEPLKLTWTPRYAVQVGVIRTKFHAAGTPRVDTVEFEWVDEPAGNYVKGDSGINQRAANTRVHWVTWGSMTWGSMNRILTLVCLEPEPLVVKAWARAEERVVPLEVSLSADTPRRVTLTSADELRAIFPHASRVDVLIRTDVHLTESARNMEPVWLGEWLLRDLPMEAEAVEPSWIREPNHSLVPAQARPLTGAEALAPPVFDHPGFTQGQRVTR